MSNEDPQGTQVAAAKTAAATSLTPGSSAPADDYDVALLDLDGVVYTGQGAVPGAPAALAAARQAGLRLAFVTNNASRTPSSVAAHLTGLGVSADAADVITSAQAAASLIADRVPPGSPVLVVGAAALRLALRACGLRPVSVAADRPVAVVQGLVTDLSYGLLAEGALAVRNGALFVAANADTTLPSPRGLQPGNGSLVQVIATATGRQPVVAGKPEPPLHSEAMRRTGANRPLVVGDRLDTDIEGAFRGDADSMLVLTGVSKPRDLVLAVPSQRPSFVAADLGGLLVRQPAIGLVRDRTTAEGGRAEGGRAEGGRAEGGRTGDGQAEDGAAERRPAGGPVRCGGWTAAWPEPVAPIELTGDGDPIDGLRALCVVAWSVSDGGTEVSVDVVDAALQVLRLPN
jgi:glycerol-1-phosphatase